MNFVPQGLPPQPNAALSHNPAMSKVFGRPTNTTKVLLLQDFAPELKTRDLLTVFQEWEDQGDGFRIKWIDDQSAYVVFFDPATAKKAFLATISNMPPSLAPSISSPGAKLTPYNGPDVADIVETAARRPRSRSNAGHQRNYSGSYSSQPAFLNGGSSNGGSGDFTSSFANGAVGGGGRHGRSESLGARFAFPGPGAAAPEGLLNGSAIAGSPENGRSPRQSFSGHHRSGSTGSMVGSGGPGSPATKADREAAAKHMAEVLARS